jgi:signal transduction histidine kinase
LDASLARQYEGAGLGLALAKGLTELLGGNLTVQSTFGKGSRFTVTLPWK